ncbi:ABATE domain-containing protein [Streptomyces sp. TRM49041]|uniref:ABATE domain-containing protein n=1 Tax=Streptomyces sp. TRM49041 TaxID=2603216 RepID=UPI0011ED5787|nr:ABATE domain-containing protein [Streptomyces sp. TRM49041]
MSVRNVHEMPWIGEDLVFDLANTVLCGGGPAGEDLDLLADPPLLDAWRGRAADPRLAALSQPDLLTLRGPVRAALDAASRQAALPRAARERLNELAAKAPVTFHIDTAGKLRQREQGGPVDGVTARRALVLAAGDEQVRLRRCPAPSCGMFFLARRKDQAWCSIGCGNRARASRRPARGKPLAQSRTPAGT